MELLLIRRSSILPRRLLAGSPVKASSFSRVQMVAPPSLKRISVAELAVAGSAQSSSVIISVTRNIPVVPKVLAVRVIVPVES